MRQIWDLYKKKLFYYKNKYKVKIYDCFLFFNENDLLEIRLNELDKVVDYFVIVESNFTFSKKTKGFNLDLKRFEKFKDKIIYIQDNVFLKSPNPWKAEKHQRNELIKGLKNAKDNDLVLLTDLDEIPRQEKIIEAFYIINYLNRKYVRLGMENYFYAFNNKCKNCALNYAPIFTTKQNITSMQDLRKVSKEYVNIPNAGWHYSFLCSFEDMIKKIDSYSHQEANKPPNNDIKFIEARIKDGKSNYSYCEEEFQIVKLNRKNCSKYLLKSQEKYAKLIFGYEKTTFWSQVMYLYNQKVCQVKKYTLGLRNKSS